MASLFLSCASTEEKKAADPAVSNADSAVAAVSNYFRSSGDSMIIPSFEIEVVLSKLATEKLARDKETVIVAAWFAGSPMDTSSKEFKESGEIFVNTAQVELAEGRIAKFEQIKFAKSLYDSLADKDIRVLINVFSGRRSTQDNLLDCSILSEKMSVVKDRKFVLAGKLIAEAVADSSINK